MKIFCIYNSSVLIICVRMRRSWSTLDTIDVSCLVYLSKNLNKLSKKYQSIQNQQKPRHSNTKYMLCHSPSNSIPPFSVHLSIYRPSSLSMACDKAGHATSLPIPVISESSASTLLPWQPLPLMFGARGLLVVI